MTRPLLAWLVVPWVAVAQIADTLKPASDSLFLRMVIPDRDTVITPLTRHRFAASTVRNARAFVAGKEVRVYPSGGFAALTDLPPDTSSVEIKVIGQAGDSIRKTVVFIRARPPRNSPRDTLTIDTVMMEPSDDRWLGLGEVLEVRFKGSPGYEASFSIEGIQSGIPMRELASREAGGFEGVYAGTYTVRLGEEVRDVPVEFKLRKSFWSSEEAVSNGKVSFLPSELPRVGELAGRRPFLNVGLGDDRLGGAKLGYLEPGVRLVIVGKARGQYKIQLTEFMRAWVPEENIKLLPVGTPAPSSLVGAITASGGSTEDFVLVGLTRRLPYTTEQQMNPAAIIVNIFGATSNTNWITHHLSAKGIETISWEQPAENHYRLKITLASGSHWGYDVGYRNGNDLQIRIRRPPQIAHRDSVLKNLTIAVDAGHGGSNIGALGSTGIRETDVTLSIAREMEKLLKIRGSRVFMTRKDSIGISTADRVEQIISSGAQLLVSIHCNSVGFNVDAERVQGTATFYYYAGFKPLANQLYERLLDLGLVQFGVVGSFNFALNGLTQLPNVLVETAFISNPEDELRLMDEGFRRQIAAKLIQGLEEFVRKKGLFSEQSPLSR